MSRTFTIRVECLGTKIEWSCDANVASAILPSIELELRDACSVSAEKGRGYCGKVSHKSKGLSAYHQAELLADKLSEVGETGKATVVRELSSTYAAALSDAAAMCQDFEAATVRADAVYLLQRNSPQERCVSVEMHRIVQAQESLISLKLTAVRYMSSTDGAFAA